MKTKPKAFDCVRMKHEGARRVQETIKGMTVEEELAYWRKRHEEMVRKKQELLRESG